MRDGPLPSGVPGGLKRPRGEAIGGEGGEERREWVCGDAPPACSVARGGAEGWKLQPAELDPLARRHDLEEVGASGEPPRQIGAERQEQFLPGFQGGAIGVAGRGKDLAGSPIRLQVENAQVQGLLRGVHDPRANPAAGRQGVRPLGERHEDRLVLRGPALRQSPELQPEGQLS